MKEFKKLLKKIWSSPLLKVILFLTILFALFYPSTFVSVDEHSYFYNAVNIVKGTLKQVCTESLGQYKVQDYCIFKYNIGTSVFLAPFIFLNAKLVFVGTFLMFLAGVVIFSKFLKFYKLNPKYVYLYALFPSLIYYSRTLYSEIFSITTLFAGSYFLITGIKNSKDRNLLIAGILFGIATFCRYSNPFLIIALVLIFTFTKDLKILIYRYLLIGLGCLPFLIAFLFFNNYLYLSPLHSGYFFSNEEQIHIWSQIPYYSFIFIGILMLLYPLMFISPLFLKNSKLKIATFLVCLILFVIYGAFPNVGEIFKNRVLDVLFGSRYLLAAVPFFLINYASFLEILEKKWPKFKHVYSIFIIALGILAIVTTVWHYLFLLSKPQLL